MGWELVGKPLTQRVTARLAKEFAEMEAAHVDRPLSERRLQVYRKVRSDGGFRPVSWAKAWCVETEQFYRVNGKHTSTLFSDGDNPENLYAVVEEYRCGTLEDVAKLYATFDSQSQTRSTGDINRSFANVISELASFPTRLVNLCVSALNFDPSHPQSSKGQAAERAEVLFDNVDTCIWLRDILGDQNKFRHLHRVAVAGAIIASGKKSKTAATQFWTAVREETGERPDLPDRKLAKFLITTRVYGGNRTDLPARFIISQREYFVKCARAWNAWRKGESTDMKYSPAHKIPAFA